MRYLTLFVLAMVLGLVLAGCSAPATPTPTLVPATPTTSPEQALVAAAQKEGALKLYMSFNEQEAKPFLAHFTEKYPFLKIDFSRTQSDEIVQKVLSEAKAGTLPPDAVEMDSTDMLQLLNEKILAAYKSPQAASYPDGAKHPWGYYTTMHINGIVIAYNTKMVKPEEAPKSLSDLLDAKWAGKMAIEAQDWAMMPFTAKVMGDTPANALWTKLADQKIKVIKGHTEVATAVANGQYALTPTAYAHRIEALKKSGQPIDWVKTEPVYASLQAIAITAQAPHPNAARLFTDWVLSAEGQAEVANMGRIPIRPGVKANPASMTEGVKFYYGDPMSIPDITKARNDYNKLFPLK
jgi:iron(III) transport system substrate-binding protein